jgi:ribonuclease E
VLRSLEDRLITDGVVPLVATTAVDVALYILNQKRSHLKDIEQRYRIPITVTADENLHVSQFVIERSAESEIGVGESPVVQMDWAHHQPQPAQATLAEAEGEQARRRSRRRRRKRRGPGESEFEPAEAASAFAETADMDEDETERETTPREPREPREAQAAENGGQNRKPRRRGRRGGRRGRGGQRPEGGERQGETRAASPEAREPGDAVRPEGEARAQQNGGGRTAPEAASHHERIERPPRESEPSYAVPVTERPVAPSEIKVESDSKEEQAPPRRGWWQR